MTTQNEPVSTFSNSSESIVFDTFAHNTFDSQKIDETITEKISFSRANSFVCTLFEITSISLHVLSSFNFQCLCFPQFSSWNEMA